jgi:predicted flap endonuclease-1-like 5' DNA nuclease
MGTKAFLQKGRTKPGIVLPATAVERVNQAADRSALVRAAEVKLEAKPTPSGKLGMTSYAKLTVAEPEPKVEAVISTSPDGEVAAVTVAAPKGVKVGMSSNAQPEVIRNGVVVEPKPLDLSEEIERVKDNIHAAIGVPADLLEPEPIEPCLVAPATTQNRPLEPAPKPKKHLPADTPLTVVAGIGTALAERFAAYGYGTLEALAKADPTTIDEIPGARKRGQQWIDEAKARLGS